MDQEEARHAAIENAITRIEPGMTIGLGSGRAVFALTKLIGETLDTSKIKAIVASPATGRLAEEAGISVVDLDATTTLDVAFDGADEVDPDFEMIKGGGAALLTEKLVLSSAKHVVIMIEQDKLVKRLGDTRLLPVEVVRFGWETTRDRVLQIVPTAVLRTEAGLPVVTPQDHYILDCGVPAGSITELASALKLTLGVIEHGLFLDQANELIVGQSDGSIEVQTRP